MEIQIEKLPGKIPLEEIFPLQNLEDYKAHFAVTSKGGTNPLDVFVTDKKEWENWNSWRYKYDDFSRNYIFSLIRYSPLENKWLFGGIWKVLGKYPCPKRYDIKLEPTGAGFIGRLLIDHPHPGTRGRAFYLEKHYPKMLVSQIFPQIYSGEAFKDYGFDKLTIDFNVLESIFKTERIDWKSALETIKGIYLIVDKGNHGKMYVGSAYGPSGIWSRWACYIQTGHGWNDELTRLIKEKGINYARQHFQFSLLEVHNMKTDDQTIIDRETYWKQVLQSGKWGYNKN